MSSPVRSYFWLGFISTAIFLSACAQDKKIELNLGDVEDFVDYLDDKEDTTEPKPFKAEPLHISANGEVRAQPDIAVITATISGEDKNESRAMNSMSAIINTVQEKLADREVETGFTAVNAQRKYDELCQEANNFSRSRHSAINSDYWFNKRLDQRGDKKTKRRKPKQRLAQRVCSAQKIKVTTQVVIRITPADAAGDVLRVLSDAGAENTQLYGYDFSNYDALYQRAAKLSVENARKKAQNIANVAGATLGELETFSVTKPSHTGRFGPQPNIIRSNRPRTPTGGSVVDRQVNQKSGNSGFAPSAYVAQMSCWDGSLVVGSGQCPARAINSEVTGSQANTQYVTVPALYETVTETVVAQEASTELVSMWDGSVQERVIPAITKQVAKRVIKTPVSTTERVVPRLVNSNALSISLLSGPQTIKVTAYLSYAYTTPLDGKIIVAGED